MENHQHENLQVLFVYVLGKVIDGLSLIQGIENVPVGSNEDPQVDVVISVCEEMFNTGITTAVNGTDTDWLDCRGDSYNSDAKKSPSSDCYGCTIIIFMFLNGHTFSCDH